MAILIVLEAQLAHRVHSVSKTFHHMNNNRIVNIYRYVMPSYSAILLTLGCM